MIGPDDKKDRPGVAWKRDRPLALTELDSEQTDFGGCGPDSERSAVAERANAAEPFWLEVGTRAQWWI